MLAIDFLPILYTINTFQLTSHVWQKGYYLFMWVAMEAGANQTRESERVGDSAGLVAAPSGGTD